jgi:hypothetical protein
MHSLLCKTLRNKYLRFHCRVLYINDTHSHVVSCTSTCIVTWYVYSEQHVLSRGMYWYRMSKQCPLSCTIQLELGLQFVTPHAKAVDLHGQVSIKCHRSHETCRKCKSRMRQTCTSGYTRGEVRWASPVDRSHPPWALFPDQVNGTIRTESRSVYQGRLNDWCETHHADSILPNGRYITTVKFSEICLQTRL